MLNGMRISYIGVGVCLLVTLPATAQVSVSASGETVLPSPASSVATDLALWIHPTDVTQSLIIGAHRSPTQQLVTYSLGGGQIQQLVTLVPVNGVDLRYNFSLAQQPIALVAVTNQVANSIGFYTVDAGTRMLQAVPGNTLLTGTNVTGVALCYSFSTRKYYAVATHQSGAQQWEVFDNDGGIDGNLVRSLILSSRAEGCVCDDALDQLYVAEDAVGIWKYGLNPDAGTSGILVDSTDGGHLSVPVKGLSIYHAHNGLGYLIAASYPIASSQRNSTFSVYRREGANAFAGSFQVVIDGGPATVTATNGQDVTNFNLGGAYPDGLFVAQDNNAGSNNFKLVSWGSIARAFYPALVIDNTLDPRQPEILDAGPSDAGRPDGGDGGSGGSPSGPPGGGPGSPQSTGCNCSSATAGTLALVVIGLGLARSRRGR
jgi:myo-inositol-hexaphosphate 3-phosphohydrolase